MSKVLLFVTVLGEIFAHLWRHTTYIGSGRRFATKPTRPYQTLPDPTRPYQTLQDPTRPYQTLQDPTRPYQTLPDPTRPYQTLQDPTRPYQTLPDPTRPYKTGCPETLLSTDLHCVTSQKSEDLIGTAAEAWYHA